MLFLFLPCSMSLAPACQRGAMTRECLGESPPFLAEPSSNSGVHVLEAPPTARNADEWVMQL
jgi:hypothetical protein